jgi:ribosomal protein S18 acetylase RimI-like enzyme
MRLFTQQNPGWGFVDEHTPELSMAVLPQYRNLGIGTALLQHIIDATRTDYDALSLSVDPRNPAVHLYTRYGFVPCGESGTSITMIRRLEIEGREIWQK